MPDEPRSNVGKASANAHLQKHSSNSPSNPHPPMTSPHQGLGWAGKNANGGEKEGD